MGQTTISMFSGSVNTTGIGRLLCIVNKSDKSQMAALTGNGFEIAYILPCIHETNEISTATPCYRVQQLFGSLAEYAQQSRESKIANTKPEIQTAT